MKALALFMMFINLFVLIHSVLFGHYQDIYYNLGWISAITAWAFIHINKPYLKFIPRALVGGSIGLLLYARFIDPVLSYTEVLGWVSSVGAWGIVLLRRRTDERRD